MILCIFPLNFTFYNYSKQTNKKACHVSFSLPAFLLVQQHSPPGVSCLFQTPKQRLLCSNFFRSKYTVLGLIEDPCFTDAHVTMWSFCCSSCMCCSLPKGLWIFSCLTEFIFSFMSLLPTSSNSCKRIRQNVKTLGFKTCKSTFQSNQVGIFRKTTFSP